MRWHDSCLWGPEEASAARLNEDNSCTRDTTTNADLDSRKMVASPPQASKLTDPPSPRRHLYCLMHRASRARPLLPCFLRSQQLPLPTGECRRSLKLAKCEDISASRRRFTRLNHKYYSTCRIPVQCSFCREHLFVHRMWPCSSVLGSDIVLLRSASAQALLQSGFEKGWQWCWRQTPG